MANRSYYHRSFIILKPLSKGFGLEFGKEPGGYCKFETRRGVGKAYIYVQDLKPGSLIDGVYEAYLISMDEDIEPYRLAGLHIDSQGRGEYIASFDSRDIKGTGYTLEHFHGLVVVFRSESEEEGKRLAYPLVGYSGRNFKMEPIEITEKLKIAYGNEIQMLEEEFHKEQSTIADSAAKGDGDEEIYKETTYRDEALEPRDTPEDPSTEVPFITEEQTEGKGYPAEDNVLDKETQLSLEPYETLVEEGIEPGADTHIPEIEFKPLDTYPTVQPFYREENIGDEERAVRDSSKIWDEQGDREQEAQNGSETGKGREDKDVAYGSMMDEEKTDGDGPTYWESVGDYFEGLFRSGQRIYPFGYDLTDTQWVRVQQLMPGGYYTEGPYSYPNAYPDHYIVGLYREDGKIKNIIYGTPSMYSLIPPTSLNGFSRWMPMVEGNGMGYWLMYIDAKSGKIIST